MASALASMLLLSADNKYTIFVIILISKILNRLFSRSRVCIHIRQQWANARNWRSNWQWFWNIFTCWLCTVNFDGSVWWCYWSKFGVSLFAGECWFRLCCCCPRHRPEIEVTTAGLLFWFYPRFQMKWNGRQMKGPTISQEWLLTDRSFLGIKSVPCKNVKLMAFESFNFLASIKS